MDLATEKYHFTKEQILCEEQEIRSAINDISCFSVLYDRYYVSLFRYVYYRVESEEDAADITSQVFLKAMLNLKKYQFRGLPFASWLYRVAVNEINQEYRKNKFQRVFNTTTEHLHQIAEEIEEDNSGDMIQLILKTLNSLGRDEMELVEMRFFEKRPFREISAITGLTETNLKVKMHRIIQKLKSKVLKKVRS